MREATADNLRQSRPQPLYQATLAKISGLLALAAIGFAPFPLGSNREWAWSPLALVVALASLALCASMTMARQMPLRVTASLYIAIACFGSVAGWAFVQGLAVATDGGLGSFFSSADIALGEHVRRGVVDPERAITGAMRLLTYGALFLIVACASRNVTYARAFHVVLIASAVGSSAYGWFMELATHSCMVFGFVRPQYQYGGHCFFSGTFVNSANYTDFATIAALSCLASIQNILIQAGAAAVGWRERWRIVLIQLAGPGAFFLAALSILVGSITFAASRAGLASFIVAAIAMCVLHVVMQPARRAVTIATAAGIAVFVAAAISLSGDWVVRRSIALFTDGASDRSAIYDLTLKAISIRPWTGWGIGSFESLYSVFQPATLALNFDKAHSAYLESVLELGVLGACVLFTSILAIAARIVRGVRERRRDTHFSVSAFGATVALGLHSTVDFGIQIPAVAAAYVGVLAVGWTQSWSDKERARW